MRTWLITGASRGFGARIAQQALAAGDSVIGSARNPEDVIAALGEHAQLLAVPLDVNNEAAAHEAVAAGIKRFGRIDVLVNNAGYGLLGAVEESSSDEVQRLFATNVFGLLNVTRAVLPHMRRQRSGRVINMSSIGGYASHVGWGIYCATKFAVEGISEAMSGELAPLGIYATVVEPGFFRTDFLDDRSLSRTDLRIDDYAETVGITRTLMADHNHKQLGDPAKLATAIMQLVDAEQPPLRLALGSDTVARIESKNQQVAEELAQWRELALSTDFAS